MKGRFNPGFSLMIHSNDLTVDSAVGDRPRSTLPIYDGANRVADHSRYQQGIIKRYYKNLDAIQSHRLAEMAAEIYLADDKKREKLWKRVGELLKSLEFPQSRIDHVLTKKDPALLPGLIQELESQGK